MQTASLWPAHLAITWKEPCFTSSILPLQFQKLRRSLPFAGAKAEQEADEGQELVNGTEMSLSNGAMQDKKVQTLTPEQAGPHQRMDLCAILGVMPGMH